MQDRGCVEFLHWALPRLGLRWPGFRKARGQVCKRLSRRCRDLGLDSLNAYRRYLETCAEEWEVVDTCCTITISRFFRDRGVFSSLEQQTLPALAQRHRMLKIWSAGCASGEEPYSLSILWQLALAPAFPEVTLTITGSEWDPVMRRRAERACYRAGSLKEIPGPWRQQAFDFDGREYCLRPVFRRPVAIIPGDLRRTAPPGPFHLILCRNLAFTYFDEEQQRAVLSRLRQRLSPDGRLVIGSHERLPADGSEWIAEARAIYRPQ